METNLSVKHRAVCLPLDLSLIYSKELSIYLNGWFGVSKHLYLVSVMLDIILESALESCYAH